MKKPCRLDGSAQLLKTLHHASQPLSPVHVLGPDLPDRLEQNILVDAHFTDQLEQNILVEYDNTIFLFTVSDSLSNA